MTSEAKIGLLLGLVFIFIIAFIINGLPSFWNESSSNELTIAAESAENDVIGIAANERKASEAIESIEPAHPANNSVIVETQDNPDVRFVAELPKDGTGAAASAELQPVTVAQALPPDNSEQASDIRQLPVQSQQQTYVVCEGDSLYTIAKKFYGASAANKKATIDLIFSTNRNVLKSPDMLYIGQKLVIPQMTDKLMKKSGSENATVNTVKTQATKPQQNVVAGNNQTGHSRDYVVQSGDSLWKIAEKQLGNGSRYKEIAEINSDVLPDEESLTVGMHLKLPTR